MKSLCKRQNCTFATWFIGQSPPFDIWYIYSIAYHGGFVKKNGRKRKTTQILFSYLYQSPKKMKKLQKNSKTQISLFASKGCSKHEKKASPVQGEVSRGSVTEGLAVKFNQKISKKLKKMQRNFQKALAKWESVWYNTRVALWRKNFRMVRCMLA